MTTRFRSWQFRRRRWSWALSSSSPDLSSILTPSNRACAVLASKRGIPRCSSSRSSLLHRMDQPIGVPWRSPCDSAAQGEDRLAPQRRAPPGGVAPRRRDDRALPSGGGSRRGPDDPQVLNAGRRGRNRLGRHQRLCLLIGQLRTAECSRSQTQNPPPEPTTQLDSARLPAGGHPLSSAIPTWPGLSWKHPIHRSGNASQGSRR